MKKKIRISLIIILVLSLSLIFINSVFADLYVVSDQEGKIIAITNQNIFKAEYQELGYIFKLWFKQTGSIPTLDSLAKDWESQIKELKMIPKTEIEKSGPRENIKILDWTNYLSSTGNYYYVEGILKNVGKSIAEYIQVKVIAYDKYKKLVSLKESYANPSNLSPGQEATFKVMVNYNPKIDNFEIKVNWR